MSLDTIPSAKVKSLADLAGEFRPEECPVCKEQTLVRCGAFTRCYSKYCEDESDGDYGLP